MSFSYGEMVYFLLICIAAILESVWWIPTDYKEKKIFSNYPATSNSEIFLPHLVLYFTQSRIGMCYFVRGSFFIWKFEAQLHNKVMIYSKERAFGAFWKLILEYLPFIDQFLPHLLWKWMFWTRICLFWKLTQINECFTGAFLF